MNEEFDVLYPALSVMTEREVTRALKISRSSLRRWVAQGNFPRPIRLGLGRIGWRLSIVMSWLDQRAIEAKGGTSNVQ